MSENSPGAARSDGPLRRAARRAAHRQRSSQAKLLELHNVLYDECLLLELRPHFGQRLLGPDVQALAAAIHGAHIQGEHCGIVCQEGDTGSTYAGDGVRSGQPRRRNRLGVEPDSSMRNSTTSVLSGYLLLA